MASLSARRVANTFQAITPQFVSRLRNNNHNFSKSALVDSVLRSSSPSPSSSPPPHTSGGAFGSNPNFRHTFGVGELFTSRHSAGAAELGQFVSSRGMQTISSSFRVHGLGAYSNTSSSQQFMAAGRSLQHQHQQVRNIFVEVKGNELDRAIRKWRRKCKEENLKVLKDREYFKKPSEKRVLALKERDRRIAKRAFKVKLNWILNRRQRGF